VVEQARLAASKMGKSLNQVVRDYLEQLAGSTRRAQDWEAFEAQCLASGGKLKGRRFHREEANER
jgi:hypothetical protein